MISKKNPLPLLCSIALLVILTFLIPTLQWIVSKFASFSRHTVSISSIFTVFCACLWYWRTKSFSFLPSSLPWKIFCYLGWLIVFGLLFVNIHQAPVAKITGQPRSAFEVIDVIVFSPMAEELVFRGVIWSIFATLFRNNRSNAVVILVGSSLLFGVEHLGYWAQSNWPLPVDAFFHASLMVVAGVCFGMFRKISRSLAVPMAVHMLANGIILLAQ